MAFSALAPSIALVHNSNKLQIDYIDKQTDYTYTYMYIHTYIHNLILMMVKVF